MPIQREFLGGEQQSATKLRPALVAAAEYLLDRYARGSQARLGTVIAVLPSSRAGRRLLEILVEECERRKLILEPPIMGTVGSMPEHLYEIKKPLASELTQRFAWAEALRTTAPKLLANLLPHPPASDDPESWLELGALVQKQHRELASDKFDFAAVLKVAKKLPGFDEEPRWKALADVQKRYLALLDSLEVWDVQTARLFAIEHKECATEKDLVLIGVSDMNMAMRAMLDQVASKVTVLVHAPRAWQDRFDAHGCVIPEQWSNAILPFDDGQVLRVDAPADQAYAVAEQLARYDGQYRADEITIGLGDVKLFPQLARQLNEFDISTRFVNERTVATTGPYLLLTAVRHYLQAASFANFAALVRHPDVHDWLRHQGIDPKVLTQLDDLQVRRLPSELLACDDWLVKQWPLVATALDKVCAWLKPLRRAEQKLAAWVELIQQVLLGVYSHRLFQRDNLHDRATLDACEQLHGGLEGFAQVPESLAPRISAVEALHLVLTAVASEQVAPPADEQAIEMLGWFELPLDDAPALIVTGFNEGFVPSSHGADMFLPNRLRQQLGINHSDRLYARDAYAVSILLATRQQVTWVVGRHDSDRNPLAPSRLLFAADRETIAARARIYFDDEAIEARPKLLLGGSFQPLAESKLEVPAPLKCDAPPYLRVTDFRTYLSCPYRFYLKRLMKLSALSDAADELDAMQFGNLLHKVLQVFGTCKEATALTDDRRLSDWLANSLYEIAREELGTARRPAVNVQIEHVRARLNAFARWQAQHTAKGWSIQYVEYPIKQTLQFGAHEVLIQGQIDRIDHHADRNEWLVLDYKSGDAGDPPDKTHRHGDEWIDLQLPLYRRLAQQIEGITAPPHVGYVVLPKRSEAVGHHLADWSEAEWRSADEVAAQVVASIFAKRFWPPSYETRAMGDEMAPICQDLVAGRRLAEVAEGAPS